MKNSINQVSGTISQIQINMDIMEAFMINQKLEQLDNLVNDLDNHAHLRDKSILDTVSHLKTAFSKMIPTEVNNTANLISDSLFGTKLAKPEENNESKIIGKISFLKEGDEVLLADDCKNGGLRLHFEEFGKSKLNKATIIKINDNEATLSMEYDDGRISEIKAKLSELKPAIYFGRKYEED